MDLKTLMDHSKALSNAEHNGISYLARDHFFVKKDVFYDLVQTFDLRPRATKTEQGDHYHMLFALNGNEYVTMVTVEEYETSYKREQKMTS